MDIDETEIEYTGKGSLENKRFYKPNEFIKIITDNMSDDKDFKHC